MLSRSILAAALQVAFLYRGRYPSLAHRLSRLQLRHEEPNAPHEVSFEYLNQQLLWGELQSFVVFLLPLLSPRALGATPLLARLVSGFSALRRWQGARSGVGEAWLLLRHGPSTCFRWRVMSSTALQVSLSHAIVTETAGVILERCWSGSGQCHWLHGGAGSLLGSHDDEKNSQQCAICAAQPILVAVQLPCCSAQCCYMCVQQRWQRSVQPMCPVCAAPLQQVQIRHRLVSDAAGATDHPG